MVHMEQTTKTTQRFEKFTSVETVLHELELKLRLRKKILPIRDVEYTITSVETPLLFYPKRSNLLGLWLASCVLTTMSFLVLPNIFGFVGILLFGTGAVFLPLRLFSKQPSVKVDYLGIHDHSSPFSVGLIPKSVISRVTPFNQEWLAISVSHYTEFINSLPWWKRIVLVFFLRLASIWFKADLSGQIYIEHTYLGTTTTQAASLISARLKNPTGRERTAIANS